MGRMLVAAKVAGVAEKGRFSGRGDDEVFALGQITIQKRVECGCSLN